MSWKELCTMGVREDFVVRAITPGANRAALCREFGVSRKTGYKWIERYEAEGLGGLEDQSRRPRETPLQLSGELVAHIVRIRMRHPGWGPKKIVEILKRELRTNDVPSISTVRRTLLRAGLMQPVIRRRRQKPEHAPGPPKVVMQKPNDLWTVDFKGWWLAVDKTRCEPLTIRDAYSRYILSIEILPTTKSAEVRKEFEAVFSRYGLPKAILTDNGPPFVAGSGALGLTKLSAWWTSLGIDHIRTRPSTPSDNGGHERMHRDIASDLERFASLTKAHQQEACDRWRHDFNEHRPHEALKMKMPAEVYRRSEVNFDRKKPVDVVYPDHFHVRRVAKRGAVSWKRVAGYVSGALVREWVGLEEVSFGIFDVWYGHKKLGRIDFNKKGPIHIEPVQWRDSAVSPMSPY